MGKRNDLAGSNYHYAKEALRAAIIAFDAADDRGRLDLRSGYLLVGMVDQFQQDLNDYLGHKEWKLTKDTPPPLADEETQ